MNAQATNEWLDFDVELARLEAIYEFEKLKFEIMDKDWLDRYQANKFDAPIIKRYGHD